MSDVTIFQLARVLGTSPDRLLVQFSEAGMEFATADQVLSSTDKVRLLAHLRRTHGRTAQESETSIENQSDEGVEDESDDESLIIDRPFDPERIKVKTVGRTVDLLMRRIEHEEVDLAPEFQRRARVWGVRRKSQLIESLLLRIPLPVFYVAADENEHWSVVDGLQRLTTIYDYFKNAYALSGLEYLTKLDNKYFSDLPRPMRRRIEESELVVHVIEPGTPEAVMINIFKRINTGGISLTGQEIRNALNKGPARELLRSLAASEEFKSATDGTVKDERMDAQECVLRFIAFKLTHWNEYQTNNLDGFLNGAMRAVNEIPEAHRESLIDSFNRSMNAATAIFGRDAFRKRYAVTAARRNPVSKALFEAWSVNLSNLSDAQLDTLISRRAQLVSAFADLMRDDRSFDVSISYSTGVPQRVHKRFDELEKLIQRVLG